MNPLRDAFRTAVERLADDDRLAQAPAWIQELARALHRAE